MRTPLYLHSINDNLIAGLLFIAFAIFTSAALCEDLGEWKITLPKQRLPAPGFNLTAMDNSATSLEQYRGKVVLIHFWATFCLPCLEEMPALESLWRKYRDDGLVILGVTADRGSADSIREFISKEDITFPVLQDRDGMVRNSYNVIALPTSYVIGRDGKISGRAIGSRDWNSPQSQAYIGSLL